MRPHRHLAHTLASAALAAFSGCAAVGGAPVESPPFLEGGVRSVALVRSAGRADRRPRDPLDALAESLEERGIAVRVVELGEGSAEWRLDLERLHAWAEARVRSGGRVEPDRTESLGREAGEAVRKLGVDAAVLLHRFEDPLLPPLPDPTAPSARPDLFGTRAALRPAPLGAFTLVDRAGNAIALAWGGRSGAELDPSRLVNAAEAVDETLRILAGEPRGE